MRQVRQQLCGCSLTSTQVHSAMPVWIVLVLSSSVLQILLCSEMDFAECRGILQINDFSNQIISFLEVETNPSIYALKNTIKRSISFADFDNLGLLYAGHFIEDNRAFISDNQTTLSDLSISTGNQDEITILQLIALVKLYVVYSGTYGAAKSNHISLRLRPDSSLEQLMNEVRRELMLSNSVMRFKAPIICLRIKDESSNSVLSDVNVMETFSISQIGLDSAGQTHLVQIDAGNAWCRIRTRNASVEIIEDGGDAHAYMRQLCQHPLIAMLF